MAYEQNNQFGNYSQYNSNYSYEDYQYFNGFELIIIIISIVALVVLFIYGIIFVGPANRNSQRIFDMNQASLALDSFYLNSSTIPSERYYPISSCDAAINSADYEYTLREYLTGKKIEKETRVYINPNDWRSDPWGTYSKTIGERKIPMKCQDLLQLNSSDKNQIIYSDSSSSCNYSSIQSNKAYYQCYLYGSSVNGDKYSLGYYNEEKNQMVIITKRRTEKPVTVNCVPQRC
ncbi:MAG: hypothetical protein H7196_02450 [candidate division SR1 bacterium]|nr:hypothetical protein [candidate division SR1 bacterium]